MANHILITPDGQKIELSLEAYEQIQKMLNEGSHASIRNRAVWLKLARHRMAIMHENPHW